MKDLIENRQIRVFISSTFQDMQDERTELIRKTFPRLREIAAQRDVTLTEVDLRWGITKEESESGKVMEICLREVKNSIPFFIGIIGNRYGWIPAEKDISEIVKERFPKVPGYVSRQLSATEIEMQFGVLDSEVNMNAYFFINDQKEPGAEDDQEWLAELKKTRLAELKKNVRENKRYPVSNFKNPEDLADQVLAIFTKLLDNLFPMGELSPLEKERLGQRAILNSLTQVYVKNEANFTVIDGWMTDWEKRQLVITGESGMGKSSLVANWLKEKLSSGEGVPYRIIYHFIGDGGGHGDVRNIVKSLCDQIRDLYGFDADEDDPKKDSKALAGLFDRISAEGELPLLIVLDGIDQLMDGGHVKRLNWLPIVPRQIKILFTTMAEDETMQVFRDRHYPVFTLPPLTRKKRLEMVEDYLREMYSKSLSARQTECIVDDPQNENTLVLKTMLDELANFGVYERLDGKIEEYLRPDSYGEFYQVLLKNYESDFGESFVCLLLSLIAVSRRGITEDEIIRIATPDKPLRWSQFFCSFRQHMVMREGLVSFAHAHIRNATVERYLKGRREWERSCRKRLCAAFGEIKSERSMDEVSYQLDKLGDMKKLHEFLLDLKPFLYLYKIDKVQLIHYWRKLTNAGYSLKEYLPLSEKTKETDRAWILEELGAVAGTGGVDPRLSLTFLEQALSYAKTEKERADILRSLGSAMALAAKSEEALKCALEALDIQKNLFGERNSKVAASYNDAGMAYHMLGEHGKALEYVRKAQDIWLGLFGERHSFVATSFDNLGDIYGDLDEHQEALKYSLKALEIRRDIFGDDHPEVARSYNNVGSRYWILGFRQQALTYLLKALEIIRPLYGDNHHNVATSYNNISMAFRKIGDNPKALEYGLKALKIHIRLFGEMHPDTAFSYDRVGSAYLVLGERKKALECKLKALEIRRKLFGDNHADIASSYNNISALYAETEEYEKALEYGEKALEIRKRLFGNDHSVTAGSYNNVGALHYNLGELEKALDCFMKALEIRRRVFGENHLDLAESHDCVGMTLAALGDEGKAREHQMTAKEIREKLSH